MRTALTLLLGLHGAIHLLGVVNWWMLAPVPQLGGRTLVPLSEGLRPVFGLLWLLAFALLLLAAALRIAQQEAWWQWALAGVVLSQLLIIVAWSDAKFGTIANVVILAPIVIAAAHTRFERRIDDEVRTLLATSVDSHSSIVRLEELEPLPAPVRQWLLVSGVVGRERARVVRLRQRGELRTGPEQAWMPVDAVQYFTVDEPAFIWKVEATMFMFIPVTGRDRLLDGEGQMLVKAASLVRVADASDDKITLGAMLRYLGEIVWFPSAALSSSIDWEPIDETHAKATMRYAGKTVSAELSFDGRGRATGMRAERYFGGGADAKLTPWTVSCTEWRVIRGIEVPVRGDVSWKLASGDFTYYRWEILDIEINRPELYPAGAPRRTKPPELAFADASALGRVAP